MPPIKSPFSVQDLQKMSQRDLMMLHLVAKLLKTHTDFKGLMEGLTGNLASIKEGKPGRPGLAGPRVDEEALEERLLNKILAEVSKKAPDEEKIFMRLLKRIPRIQDGRPGKDAVIDYGTILEELKKRKIKPEHIDGLEQTMSSFVEQSRHRLGYVHGGGDSIAAGTGISLTRNADGTTSINSTASGTNFADGEIPTGTINSSNKIFTLAHTPSTGSLKVYLNGARQKASGEDYTLVAATITFVTAPQTGSILLADYRY